jgi:ubiquinone/menaquinone biosynthesis C-methylase UbiE
MILDVGCGTRPKGDVNIDRFIGDDPHLGHYLYPKNIPNFVKADANFLPFKDETFELVLCDDVLEHEGVNFTTALNEMLRVCKGKVKFVVPHRMNKKQPLHDKYFNVKILNEYLKRHFKHFEIETQWKVIPNIPFLIGLIRIPSGIEVTIEK